MKKNLFLSMLMIVLGVILCQCSPMPESTYQSQPIAVPAPTRSASNPGSSMAVVDPGLIKASTVLIMIQSSSGETYSAEGMSLGRGIATLIEHDGERLLVTHNHWGEYLEDLAIVEFRDTEGHMIKPLLGYEFKDLILYQDPGTLILRALPELVAVLTPAKVTGAQPLKPGDSVQVAYREKPERNTITILEAVVNEISAYEGEEIYKLQCQNGDFLQPGDSGGGVWHNGRLVGNTWAVLVAYNALDASGQVDPASETITDIAYTAILPEDF